jgi:hypothetical protein
MMDILANQNTLRLRRAATWNLGIPCALIDNETVSH